MVMALVESPRDRVRTVTLALASDPALPNIVLGALISAVIQYQVGMAPPGLVVATAVAWTLSVLIYALGDAVVKRIEEEKRQLLAPESAFYGIE